MTPTDKAQQPPPAATFVLLPGPGGGLCIHCCVCGRTSFNPNDVEQLYCGHCHRFHDDECPPALPPFPPAHE
jgi:hypothetical protein